MKCLIPFNKEVIKILGLRTKESIKFERYFAIVQDVAKRGNCVFYFDTGDGRDIVTDSFEGEDLMGWLIPQDQASVFEKEWNAWDVSSIWNKYYCFAVWDDSDGLNIKFQQY